MSRPLRPHCLTNDAKNLMFLIKHQRPPGCEHVEAFVESTTGTVLPSLDRKSTLVTLCIRKAEQLRAKDRNGSSNPYVTVTDRSDPNNHLTFESDSIERSVDPTWNFNISIVICEKSDIVISIWSKRSAGTEAFPDTYKLGKSKDSDSFLGQIVLLGDDLMGMFESQVVVENWYLLEKRSNKSSVSGRVLIEFKDVCRSGPAETIVEDVLQFSPSEVILAFDDTLRAFLGSHSQASREKSISNLEQLSKYWAIHTAGVELYASGGFEQLDVIMTEAREFSLASDASKKFQTLGLSIYHSTRRFISRTLQQPVDHYGATTLNSLVQIVQTLESFIENPLLLPHFGGASGHNLIEDCISKAIAERCCNTIESSKTVLDLVVNIVKELKAFENYQSFNIPFLVSNIYVGHIFGVLSCLESVSLDEVFKVYKETKRLASICYRIHPALLEKLNLVELFRPYVEEFLRLSETNIKQWVQRSIDLDDFALQSTGHSSSVIDIFTSFQQQIDFIIDLSWPSEIDTRIFIGKMLENITAGIEEYIDLTKESIENDLKNHLPRSFSTSSASSQTQSPPGSPSQLKFKLKVRKEGPPVDPTERRISPVSCVKLSNIEAVVARFDSLLDSIPTSFKDSLHTSNGRIPSVVEAISPNPGPCTTGILTVLRADNLHPVKPYASKLTIQVCSLASGKCLGRTGRFHQKQRLSFGHSNSSAIPIVVKDSDLANGLQLQLIFHLPSTAGESDDLNTLIFGGGSGDKIGRDSILMKATFALNSIVVDAINSGDDGVTFDVPVGGFTVTLQLVIKQGLVSEILRSRLVYVVELALHDSVNFIVDKLCVDLRQRLRDASAEYKQSVIIANNIATLFASKETIANLQSPLSSKQKPTTRSVDSKLSPLLYFIDGNLAVIAETIYSAPLANQVVRGIWTHFIDVAEGLIVPNLGDNNGLFDRRKAWEAGRVAFLAHTVGIVKDFLHADGKGLPLEQMEIESWGQLELIFRFYSTEIRELYVRHINEMSDFSDWSDAWLLKLLKLKLGYREYVVEAMRRKVIQ